MISKQEDEHRKFVVTVVPAKFLTDFWSEKKTANNRKVGEGSIWFFYFQTAINETTGKGQREGEALNGYLLCL
jgi:hypothetical protein